MNSHPLLATKPILRQSLFWMCAAALLTFIYGTAYKSHWLGICTVLMLLPVHLCYYYVLSGPVLNRLFLKEKYLQTLLALALCLLLAAVLYRLVEIFISDPFVYQYYKQQDASFTWAKLEGTWHTQLLSPTDFVNAVERSNVVVWIGIALKFVLMWIERREAAFQAELNVLKGQLHPHFLFNSLNNLYAFSLASSSKTPEIILRIANVLRYMLYECSAEKVLLKREIDILRDYIDLEQMRYESRLELNLDITGGIGTQKVAPLLMFPLVENAFKHGASETIGTPWINIEINANDRRLVFKISNSKSDVARTVANPPAACGAIGLKNIRKRLELLYPGRHHFEWFDEQDVFLAELELSLLPSPTPDRS
ncbi:MAG: histidine kinase [Dyadobacter sp. 50-39]|uniref:sensor histidine kinase n=1 Tax=Dyadobacter sp. 50-39 TaxID=1895756 RepID=UPI00095EAF28|nr:histidine kinase [Dyadobacter sp. 50-39]OJV15681.1 MAG: histidine kinase [Dyadobacter sp. 50-39]